MLFLRLTALRMDISLRGSFFPSFDRIWGFLEPVKRAVLPVSWGVLLCISLAIPYSLSTLMSSCPLLPPWYFFELVLFSNPYRRAPVHKGSFYRQPTPFLHSICGADFPGQTFYVCPTPPNPLPGTHAGFLFFSSGFPLCNGLLSAAFTFFQK